MKKTTLFSLLTIIPMAFGVSLCSAQVAYFDSATNAKTPFPDQFYVNAGVGAGSLAFDLQNNFSERNLPYMLSQSAIYHANVDYRPVSGISVGLGFSYQNFTDNPVVGFTQLKYETEFIERSNYSIRVLYHSSCANMENLYFGIRAGISYWNDNVIYPTNLNEGKAYYSVSNNTTPSIELMCGYSYFITHTIGLNMEAAVGSTYSVSGGLTFKIACRQCE